MGAANDLYTVLLQIFRRAANQGTFCSLFIFGADTKVDDLGAFLHKTLQLFLHTGIHAGFAAVAAAHCDKLQLGILVAFKAANATVHCVQAGCTGAAGVVIQTVHNCDFHFVSSNTIPFSTE